MLNAKSGDIPPPQGYTSWLDYAVDTLDTRSIEIRRRAENELGRMGSVTAGVELCYEACR